jgi:hypothetical protein
MNNKVNLNMPVGSTGKVEKVNPTMVLINKYHSQDLQCSVEIGKNPKDYFEKYGYLVIKNLFDPKEIYESVSKERGQINYYGSLEKYQHIPEETQVNGSLSRYNHPKYKFIQNQIRLILQDILQEELYNTYYFDRFYFEGQRLIRHKDRDACEISVSVQISTNSLIPWSFCIQNLEGKEVSADINDGWGILYMGCELEHWRDPLQSRYSNFGKIMNKCMFKSDNTYHHEIIFI